MSETAAALVLDRPRRRLRIAVLLVLLLIVAAAVMLFPIRDWARVVLDWIRDCGTLGPLIMIALYVPAALFLVPASWLNVAAGFFFGPWIGTIVASVGGALGAGIAFILGRTIARELVESQVKSRPAMQALGAAVGQQGFKIVMLTRLSPVLPYGVLNYLFSVSQVKFRDFLIATWLGMLPVSLMYAYLGSAAQDVMDVYPDDDSSNGLTQALFVLGLLATIMVTVMVTRLARRALREAVVLADD